jgi:hypothetical protein
MIIYKLTIYFDNQEKTFSSEDKDEIIRIIERVHSTSCFTEIKHEVDAQICDICKGLVEQFSKKEEEQ